MINFKLTTVFATLVIGLPTLSSPSLAQRGPVPTIDINTTIKQSGSVLRNLGIVPSGTVRENNDYWCTFNNWRDRDSFARSKGTYDNGRWSHGTTFGGKWYCAAKHG